MTITITNLKQMSQAELDELYGNSSSGGLPDGDSQGMALVLPGSIISKTLAPIIKLLAWKGKVFYRDQGFLFNKVSLFGFHLIKAQIYRGNSWIDGEDTIILDYSKTSFVAKKIRDEIREIAPGVYLGQAYWGKTRVLNFVLQF